MYYKFVSLQNNFIDNGQERIIQAAFANRLSATETDSILKAYRWRMINEQGFNPRYFFLDLDAYLKYKFSNKQLKGDDYICAPHDANYIQSDLSLILRRYFYLPAVTIYKDHNLRLYFSIKKKKFIRVYEKNIAEFFYQKLMGISQADINKSINNNILTVNTENIPSLPIVVMESFLHIGKIKAFFNKQANPKDLAYLDILAEIDQCRKESILSDDRFIESNYGAMSNFGLVVRHDSQKQKRVYVVDVDFHLTKHSVFSDDYALLNDIKLKSANIQPKFLDYEKLVKYIPLLEKLKSRKIFIGQ